MGRVQFYRSVMSLDPDKLRAARLSKHWTQRQLAERVGFSEDYINQLERSWATRNKGTNLETLLRFAQTLEIAPEELLLVAPNAAPPELTALLQSQRGWIATEQLGQFASAYKVEDQPPAAHYALMADGKEA